MIPRHQTPVLLRERPETQWTRRTTVRSKIWEGVRMTYSGRRVIYSRDALPSSVPSSLRFEGGSWWSKPLRRTPRQMEVVEFRTGT